VGHADVEGEPDDGHRIDAARPEVTVEARRRHPIVLEERRIAVDVGTRPLPEDQLGPVGVEIGMKRGAGRTGDTVDRPEDLLDAADEPMIERPGRGVRDGERAMTGWMPVLREHADRGPGKKPVDQRYDGVAVRNGQGAARAEVVLEIDDDQGFDHGVNLLLLPDGGDVGGRTPFRDCRTTPPRATATGHPPAPSQPSPGVVRIVVPRTFSLRRDHPPPCLAGTRFPAGGYDAPTDPSRNFHMPPPADPRRHDLDALRAVAMLLGILLHASLAYVPGIPWPVTDTRPAPWLGLLFLAIHGFRMPLFFLVSGFFTAMLWQRRGPGAMLAQRYQRVFVPLVLGFCTLLPLFDWVATRSPGATAGGQQEAPRAPEASLIAAIRAGDAAAVAAAIATGADAQGIDDEFRMPLITLAALVGDVDVIGALLDAGADAEALGDDGRTPLHAAAFAGHLPIVQRLLEAGADPAKRGPAGDSPLDSTKADDGTTRFLGGLLRIRFDDPDTLRAGREAIRTLLAARTGESAAPPPPAAPAGLVSRARNAYRDWLLSRAFVVPFPGSAEPRSLFLAGTWNYLWFLWFLCWLAVGFAAVAALATRLGIPALPARLVTTSAALLWTVPLTLLPQLFMGLFTPGFGPDTSLGLLPQPHVLAYYGMFFGYGALLFLAEHRADNDVESVGRAWSLPLLVALLLCFPVGLATMPFPAATALPQVLYAWLMSFAAIGFFRWLVPTESRAWRYLSDSAYWLYLAHMPVVIVLQQVSRGWPVPGTLKFLLVTTLATAILLVSYQLLVRHTPLGLLLNGPRPRSRPTPGPQG